MKNLLLFIITLMLVFTSCTPFDDCEFDNETGIKVLLNLKEITEPINDIHIYIFDASNRLYMHRDYVSEAELALNMLYVNNGKHTIIAILNAGVDFVLPANPVTKVSDDETPNLMLDDFIAWLKSVESQHPDMMCGMAKDVIFDNQTVTVVVEIGKGTSKIKSSVLRLNITTLDEGMPDYTTRIADYNMRTVAEVYKKGTVLRIHNHTEILKDSTLDLHLQPGEYDILLWADHTPIGSVEDHHYSTTSLRAVTFNEKMDYTAGVGSRNAFALRFEATMPEQSITEKQIALEPMLARYRIVATDVERYKGFIAANNYPELDGLITTINYQGFLPSSHDIYTGKPNDSSLGIKYNSFMTDITEATTTIASDHLFALSKDAYINVTVKISNKETGEVITSIPSVKIEYHRGYLTTVKSDYLTSGIVGEGISIDTRWEGVIDIYF